MEIKTSGLLRRRRCDKNVVLGLLKLIFLGAIEPYCHFELLKSYQVTSSLTLNVCATSSYNLSMFSSSKAPSLSAAKNGLQGEQR